MAADTAPDVLIFSKDRAAQLDLLLSSIDRYAPSFYRSLTVLWTVSGADYLRGYHRCRGLHRRNLRLQWWQQGDFDVDVRSWLDAAGPFVSFLVDDDVFYRAPPHTPAPPYDRSAYSLRGGDYDYPFSLDGNVYERADVVRLLRGLRFADPTELEASGHAHRDRLPFTRVLPLVYPCLVGLPWNRVSASSGMPHEGIHEYDLNERFLAGMRLLVPPPMVENLGAHTTALRPRWERAEAA